MGSRKATSKRPSYYDALGVGRSASTGELHEAYRRQRRRLATYRRSGRYTEERIVKSERYLERAWAALRDPQGRAEYDASLASSPDAAIETRALTKRFGQRLAVDAIDLRVPARGVTGFVGPNGAGKTTTMRLLLGLVRPTSGKATVLGAPLDHPEAYLHRVGALIEGPSFYPTLTGRANLAVLARLGGIDPSRVPEVIRRVGLSGRADEALGGYSMGMKQRLGIAAALLPQPELLVLDEPANGLDPAGVAEMRRLLRSLADDGVVVFVSSHILGEIEQVCDHIVVIRVGRIVFQGRMVELLATRTPELQARTEHAKDARVLLAKVKRAGHEARLEDGMLHVRGERGWAAELNRLAARAGITLVHLSESRAGLEEVFFEIAGEATGDTGLSEVAGG